MKNNKQFVFVVGVPRSGTTWLFNMIAEHPEFCSLNGANTLFQHYIFPMEKAYRAEKAGLKDKGFNRGMPSKLAPAEFHDLLSRYVELFYEEFPDDAPFYVEKATDLLSQAKNILRFFPDAKFIHIVRDGRNSALSDMKLHQKYGYPLGIPNVYEAAIRWKDDIAAFKDAKESSPVNMHEVKYEDLLVDTALRLKEIFEFIGCDSSLETTEAIAQKFDYKDNPVSKPTTEVADKQGKPLQPYETEMSKSDQAVFECLAGKTLDSYGYPLHGLMKPGLFSFWIKQFKVNSYFAVKSGCPFKYWLRVVERKIARTYRA